ncbi:hypothetical protein IEN85_09915 [Pelagicoccus sp. NFK12]|uniref:Uncharacterized protein n=1 Tax=Pelagicoccus enzymogenes TaxID=2773457 RepID=A0A927FAC1_9BACT|nr:hypothetical protein [Pelagicoccus enzymogenes]MBD5779808.1 hypothetical protein [Pelagicoccus enzymogenes]
MIKLLRYIAFLLAILSTGCANEVENRLFYNLPQNKKITLITNPKIELIGIVFEDKATGKNRTAYLKNSVQLRENGYAMRGLEHRFYIGGSPDKYDDENLPFIFTRIFTLHGISDDPVDLNTFLDDPESYSDVFKN